MPTLVPVVVPAREETAYPDVRVSRLGITQDRVRGNLLVSVQAHRFRELGNDVAEDCPTNQSGSVVYLDFTIDFSELRTDPVMGPVMYAINNYAIQKLIEAGKLQVTP